MKCGCGAGLEAVDQARCGGGTQIIKCLDAKGGTQIIKVPGCQARDSQIFLWANDFGLAYQGHDFCLWALTHKPALKSSQLVLRDPRVGMTAESGGY